MRVALEEVIVDNPTRRERGWKLFMMLPRMLLHRAPRGGLIPRHKLVHRFEMFSRGEWWDLIRASAACDEQAAVGRRRRRRRPGDDLESRAARAEMLVHLGELSSTRQALEGAAVAPGCNLTLTMLSDPAKRPPVLRDPVPDEVLHHVPSSLFELDEDRLLKNLRSARRGAAGGPSGMTVEHLRILLDNIRDSKLFFRACEQMVQAKVPDPIIAAIRVGRMTALRKPDGGVRGIVAGDVVRRRIARTMAQQLGKTVEAATAPYQYALSTRAGCECIAHSLQGLCEMDPTCTVLSIDGIGAFDQISRAAMLDGLLNVAGAGEALPFVLMFYGAPSVYLWEDDVGDIHTIHQGEGGEQGDALMPLLFALGQHSALDAIQENLEDGEHLFAFHDDIYTTTSPDRVGSLYALLQEHLFGYSRIRINGGKTQVWNQAGVRPDACDILERIAQASDLQARVWKGPGLPEEKQGMKVLGAPLGHPSFVQAFLVKKIEDQRTLLDRIPLLADLQASWLLLLHCAAARANYLLRVVEPGAAAQYASSHDEGLWNCLCAILQVDSVQTWATRDAATMPLVLGGIGLRSAMRTRKPAFWASWADSLPMIHARHREVASQFVVALEQGAGGPCLMAAAEARRTLTGVRGFEPPSWQAVAEGARPVILPPDEYEPGGVRQGWQHASRTEEVFRDNIFDTLSDRDRALIRSQAGPGAGVALRVAPTNRLTTIEPHLFRVVLLRRLRLPLPLSVRSCRCGRAIDIFGHHRAACSRAGVLGRRGFALESAVARICREAGGRVGVNTFMRDMDLPVLATDNRRLEVVVDGLPLYGGCQLAIDTTLVCAMHCDGSPHQGAAERDGVVLTAARRRKERRYPELVGPHSRARLVVLAMEVGGRWSSETRSFLAQLAKARSRREVPLLRKRVEQAWRLRWGAILGCAAARAVAASLLELRGSPGADGECPPSHEVVGDHRCDGLPL